MPIEKDASKILEINEHHKAYSVLFHKDGKEILSSGDDGVIRRWRTHDGKQVGEVAQAGSQIYTAVVSPDCKWLVCGLRRSKSNVVVWNLATHEKVLEIDAHEGSVWSVDVDSNSAKLATSGSDKRAFIWSLTTGHRLVGPLQLDHHIVAVRFSPGGSHLATVTSHSVHIFRSDNSQQLLYIPYQFKPILSSPLAWSADGRSFFAVSLNEAMHFDSSSGSLLSKWTIPGDASNSPSSIALSQDQKFIAIIANDSLSFWDASTHEQIGSMIKHKSRVWALSFSPNGEYIVTGEQNGTISLRNLHDITPLSYSRVEVSNHPSNQLPLMNLDRGAFEVWKQGNLARVEEILTEEIRHSPDSSRRVHALAYRALVRLRSKQFQMATDDAAQSIKDEPTIIGHIANAISLGVRKDQESVMQAFDLVFRDCLPSDGNCKFLLLIKAILFFICGKHSVAISRVHDLIATADNVVMNYCLHVLGNMYLKRGDYVRAIESLERARNVGESKSSPHLLAISLIFGWDFDGHGIAVQRRGCEALFSAGHFRDAAKALLVTTMNTSNKETLPSKTLDQWISDFGSKCVERLTSHGDRALKVKKHDDAISDYTAALSLKPRHCSNLLVKRSKALAQKKLWNDALEDANEAVKLDPSYHWGYEAKSEALFGLKQHDAAIDAFRNMLSVIEKSPNRETRLLRKNYISPSDTESVIDSAILGIYPFILINVKTGHLCDASERMKLFKSDTAFKELVSSMTREMDEERIHRKVRKYFQYVTLSHVWEKEDPEPSFQDVRSVGSIKSLKKSKPNTKLLRFCEVVEKAGYQWAWSDTCCIDKTSRPVLDESLTSMYKWYEESAATFIYLATVDSPSILGDLTRSIWMTRAWTLQELLAPKVVRFYDRSWHPYLNDQRVNHKESPAIMGELARTIRVPVQDIINFSPNSLGVREKLWLASKRNATREEDIAYSLIGIFESSIKPNYGDGYKALGQLLEGILGRYGDAQVLNWFGTPSKYNSCLPKTIAVYSRAPRTSHNIEGADMAAQVAILNRSLSRSDAIQVHDKIKGLPQISFTNGRLRLPCIAFPVMRLDEAGPGSSKARHYRAQISAIGQVVVQTFDKLLPRRPGRLILAYPWIQDLRGPYDMHMIPGASMRPHAPAPRYGHDNPVDHALALELIVRLRQSFVGLLLEEQPSGEYKRIAADHEIFINHLDIRVNFARDIRIKVVDVL